MDTTALGIFASDGWPCFPYRMPAFASLPVLFRLIAIPEKAGTATPL